MANQTLQIPLSIKATGPMLDIIIHCKTENQIIKKLKELKKLVNPPDCKVTETYRQRWVTKRRTCYVPVAGKLEGKHKFEIIHNHPQHPLTIKLKS